MCRLKYKRGKNELETKKVSIDDEGVATFNEKIEMKTFLEYDAATGRYKKKESELFAIISQDNKKQTIGSCTVDLADFASPAKHQR